ncbi:MAG: alpha/beta fold hydrolase [Acidobacteria bacterium]|nr:alpha/beta fold hydrolase [Acidobacteriota bacterium]
MLEEKSTISTESLPEVARALRAVPFRPHPLFRSGHAQTVLGYAWPRRFRLRSLRADKGRLFEVEPGVRLLVHCRWQKGERREHPTLLLVHGLEGSSSSVYVRSTGAKAFKAGFNVLRLNIRTCGGTEHLTPTLYNSSLSGDLRAVIDELISRDRLKSIFLGGFSLGGNMSLKLAGELSADAPEELRGVCAISPSIDLAACADAIERRSNWLYSRRFVKSLKRRMRHVHQLYPERYDLDGIDLVRTVRDFDARYTAVHGGFRDVDDYYARASSLPLLARIRIPVLIVHAQDDPFIPFDSFRHPSLAANPHVILLAPQHGGHVGFIADDSDSEDRFWAENRLVEFCRLVQKVLSDRVVFSAGGATDQ